MRLLNELLGYVTLVVSSLLQVLGMITQPDHLGDKIDESGFICRRIGHDLVNLGSACKRCKKAFHSATRGRLPKGPGNV